MSINTKLCVQAVIIDFGKACDANIGKTYTLVESQKEQCKKDHSHIAADLRDEASQQSAYSTEHGLQDMHIIWYHPVNSDHHCITVMHEYHLIKNIHRVL